MADNIAKFIIERVGAPLDRLVIAIVAGVYCFLIWLMIDLFKLLMMAFLK